jgi:maleylpyruvate isomerase
MLNELPPHEDSFREVSTATGRLLADLEGLTDTDATGAGLLPGWTRGHVLSHLARQATGLEGLLEWARTGQEKPQYADAKARNDAIEAGAGRPAAELIADVQGTADRLQHAILTLPEPAWTAKIRPFSGELCTPGRILVIRLRELELHHIDLDLGYGFGDIPQSTLEIILQDVTGHFRQVDGMPDLLLRDSGGAVIGKFGTGGPSVSGTRPDVLAWLTGRSAGEGLHSATALPSLPRWM